MKRIIATTVYLTACVLCAAWTMQTQSGCIAVDSGYIAPAYTVTTNATDITTNITQQTALIYTGFGTNSTADGWTMAGDLSFIEQIGLLSGLTAFTLEPSTPLSIVAGHVYRVVLSASNGDPIPRSPAFKIALGGLSATVPQEQIITQRAFDFEAANTNSLLLSAGDWAGWGGDAPIIITELGVYEITFTTATNSYTYTTNWL